jgi:hypothetical protein
VAAPEVVGTCDADKLRNRLSAINLKRMKQKRMMYEDLKVDGQTLRYIDGMNIQRCAYIHKSLAERKKKKPLPWLLHVANTFLN